MAVLGLAGALAFFQFNGRPFILALENGFFFFLNTKLYFWNNAKKTAKAVPVTIPRNTHPGGDADQKQHLEWIEGCKGGPTPYSNFDIAAYLTEIILLGCVALRTGVGHELEWDGPNMRATNEPMAAQFVKRQNRTGWVA